MSAQTDLELSVLDALVGELTPAVYGVCALVEGRQIVLTCYVAPEMTEDEREGLLVAGTEVVADYPEGYLIDERIVDVPDRSAPLPTVGAWVILQRGLNPVF